MRWIAAVVAVGLAFSARAAEPEPSGYRGEPYKAAVPATLSGSEVVDTREAQALWKAGVVFVDVLPHAPRPADLPANTIWHEPPHLSVPGAIWLPDVGYQALAPETLQYMLDGLAMATGGARDADLVFFCKSQCWMSWNAAKRAIEHGYSAVIWYPGGVDGWAEAGLPLAPVQPATP